MKRILLLLMIGFVSWSMTAQTSLEGKVTDLESGEPIIFGSVALYKNDVLVTGTETDLDGNYSFSNIDPGTYDVEISYVGYQTQRQEGVLVNAGKANRLDVQLSSGVNLQEVVVVDYEVPLVEQDKTTTGGTITSENIRQMPLKDIQALAATTAGVSSQDGGAINIGGARSQATVYYIDGMRVTGRMVPQTEIEQMQVLTGGIPAQYGDLAGGAISVTTKGPSAKYSGAAEVETSEFLDPFGYNLFYGNLSGPIIRNSQGKSILGFRLAAQYRLRDEDDPPALGVYRATEESIEALNDQPLTTVDGLTLASAEFYRGEENGGPVQELDARPNEEEEQLDVTAKFDLRLSDNIDVQVTGTYFNNNDRFTPSGSWGVFNYTRNPYTYEDRFRGIFRFRHRLGRQSYGGSQSDDEKKARSASLIRNAVYTIEAGYQYAKSRNEDLIHQDNLFNYGYIGKFNVDYEDRAGLVSSDVPGAVRVPVPTPGGNVIDTFYAHTFFSSGLNEENPYEPNMDINPVLVNYNKGLFDERPPGSLGDFNTYNGFVSGVFNTVWTLYNNVGTVYNTFSKGESEIYTLQANSSFDFLPGGSDKGRHNIQLGILWEQRVNRGWNVSPFGLWEVARQQVNSHITGVNYDAPIDGETFIQDVSPIADPIEFQVYEYNYEDAGTSDPFWKSIREELGVPLYEPLNVDGIDPSRLSLDLFATRELTDQALLGYFGYDYLGNKTSSDITFDDFWTDRDADGDRTYLVAPYRPVYFAGYIQDKFTFRDIIFRLGVRVERFDANTRVLKDQRSLYEIQTADEFFANREDRPDAVGDDFLVYIQEPNSPVVKGFRQGNTWFDANGTQLNDGTELFQGGVVTPAYVQDAPDIKADDFEVSQSFEDYTPQWNVLPRLAFSFPISDEANFFAHYDILAQRPSAGQGYVSPLQYFYFEDAGRTPLDNPNLRPVKTINYEVGFRQKISNSSAITISAFYREMRDLIQRQTILFVPGNVGQYDTYGNLDFGTVKEFKFQYDLRRTGNLQVRASYRLQFADGTGSNADSQSGLTDRGNLRTLFPLNYDERHRFVANIDYRYGSGKRYTGPKWFGTDVFANAGLNIQASAVSGRPYTPALAPGRFTGLGFAGGFNSARKPWTFAIDAKIDKNFNLSPAESGRRINLNVYLRCENVLDARNVVNVYTYTGSPTRDGYLQFNVGEADIQQYEQERKGIAANEQVYIEAYNWRMLNPNLFVQPRRIYLGAIVEF